MVEETRVLAPGEAEDVGVVALMAAPTVTAQAATDIAIPVVQLPDSSGVDVSRIPELLTAVWPLHHRDHAFHHRLRRHRRNDALVLGLCRYQNAGFLNHRRPRHRLLLYDSLDPSPQGLGDEGLHLRMASGALLRTPTRSFLDDRPGGVICAAPAVIPRGVDRSGRFGSALASVAPVPRR